MDRTVCATAEMRVPLNYISSLIIEIDMSHRTAVGKVETVDRISYLRIGPR